MKYPYIGKSKFSDITVIFTSPNQGAQPPSGSFVGGWAEGNFANITREYLANTWGEVKSKEHAEFLIDLCASNGISCAHYNLHCKCFSVDHDGLYFWSNETMARAYGNGDKQITIPEPPQQNTNTPEEDFEMKQKDMVLNVNSPESYKAVINKNYADSVKITIGEDIKSKESAQKVVAKTIEMVKKSASAVKTLEKIGYEYKGGELWKPPIGNTPDYINGDNLKECGDNLIFGAADKCSEWPCLGDEVHTKLGHKATITGLDGGIAWIKHSSGFYAIDKVSDLSKPKSPEEELRDDLTDLVMRARDADATDSVIANSIMAKYNITKK